METEQRHYELRNRSRSRSETPQIHNRTITESESSEHRYALRSKSRERSQTPGDLNKGRQSVSRPGSSMRLRDLDAVDEQKDDALTDTNSEKSLDKTITTTRKSERRSERQRVRRQIYANGQTEAKDDSSDTKSETKERKRRSATPRKIITSDYSSEDGDREDPPSRPGSAYEFYKQQGEWWNIFPKTDYTYAQMSQHRYEVAPGVMAIPNMSRRSIHSDNSMEDSVLSENDVQQVLPHNRSSGFSESNTVYKKRYVDEYRHRRENVYTDSENSVINKSNNEKYASWLDPASKYSTRYYNSRTHIDSDTELDEAMTLASKRWRLREARWYERFTSPVSSLLYATFHLLTLGLFKKQDLYTSQTYSYSRYKESKWSRAFWPLDFIFKCLYLMLVKVLFLDSWLLSRASSVRGRVPGRRSKVFWLALLPLIMVAGWWYLPQALNDIEAFGTKIPWKTRDVTEAERLNIIITKTQSGGSSADEELRLIVERLINRVRNLENEDSRKSEHLSNITRILQDLGQRDSEIWANYDMKLSTLEKTLKESQDDTENRKDEVSAIKYEFRSLRELYVQLKSCCDANPKVPSSEDIERHVEKVFAAYFGDNMSRESFAKVIRDFSRWNEETKARERESVVESGRSDLQTDDMRRVVKEILKVYDADKTGRVDYALESAGGQIISVRCTQRYSINTRAIKILGVALYYESIDPRTVIQGNSLQPGLCWAFQDFPGYLLIKLRSSIHVTGFTLEHAPRSILPNEEIKSAPRKFNVWGLREENDPAPVMFGEYEFLDSDESLQYFPVQNTSIVAPYEFVELRIHSNHGQLEYTCLYRFRVHGRLA